MRQYLAFDIEIVKALPDGFQDWRLHRPLGISCAATFTGSGQPTIWHGKTVTGDVADQMDQSELRGLVEYLQDMARSGYGILTWNGVGFDFDVLAEESRMWEACHELALNHVDMMYHVFCVRGHVLGLDRAAKGMKLAGKLPGMHGGLAPRYWAEGRRQEVLDYVAQDVRSTLMLAEVAEREQELRWVSARGFEQRMPLSNGWWTVRDAQALPLPDTSWMPNPWPRSKFTGWLE